jgi:hypothetical protein
MMLRRCGWLGFVLGVGVSACSEAERPSSLSEPPATEQESAPPLIYRCWLCL